MNQDVELIKEWLQLNAWSALAIEMYFVPSVVWWITNADVVAAGWEGPGACVALPFAGRSPSARASLLHHPSSWSSTTGKKKVVICNQERGLPVLGYKKPL